MISLPLTSRHIVDDRVAPYVIKCICFRDLEARFAYDDSKLAFIIQGLGKVCVWVDLVAICDDGREPFGEDDGMCGLIDFV